MAIPAETGEAMETAAAEEMGRGTPNGGGAGGQSAILQPGATASALGRLNASHASATALANAAPNSAVGKIAAYEKALTSYQSNSTDQSDLTALKLLLAPDGTCPAGPCQTALATVKLDLASVEAALAAAANKPITAVVVTAVDTNLGLTVDPAVEAAIAADAGP